MEVMIFATACTLGYAFHEFLHSSPSDHETVKLLTDEKDFMRLDEIKVGDDLCEVSVSRLYKLTFSSPDGRIDSMMFKEPKNSMDVNDLLYTRRVRGLNRYDNEMEMKCKEAFKRFNILRRVIRK